MSRHILLLFFIITTKVFTVLAADIRPGSALSAADPNSKWASHDNTSFSFTFIPDPSSAGFLAAIIYDNNPSIPIWMAGASASATDSNATLRLLPNGNLELRNGSSHSLVWESSTSGRGVSSASLDDSGNFVLRNANASIIWSTFENPTDTIVPGQKFTKDQILVNGIYSFGFKDDGNLALKWNNSITYYSSGLDITSTNLSSPSLSIRSIGIITLSDALLPSPLNLAYSSDYAESYGDRLRFVKLDNDGNLRIYSSFKDSGSSRASAKWSALSHQCEVFGYCGNMGICSYDDQGPVCRCPSLNFELVDARDSRKGCRSKVDVQNCQGNNQTMLQLHHTVLLTYPPESNEGNTQGIQTCRIDCLLSSACLGSTSMTDRTEFCYQKMTNFISGYQSPTVPSTTFIKICGRPDPYPHTSSVVILEKNSWRMKLWIVVVVVLVLVSVTLALILLQAALWCWCFRGSLESQYELLEYASGAPVQFSYTQLQRATNEFKDKLGVGGFGAVYKGVLANSTVAAVKQLEVIKQGEIQFRMEVATISSINHLNSVRLIGFCSEGRHRLLVYEYMKNGSLDKFLFCSEKMLNWDSRYNIALGTAKGITYLHEECRECIVHCDIKPENILLDENYNAKVSDFGLAKLINPMENGYQTLTSVRGTRGYLAPERLANLPITSKSDIYSYGMVLLEIVSGIRNFDIVPRTNNKRFSTWAYEEFDKGNVIAIVDPRLSRSERDMEQVMRAVKVSFWCIQQQPSQRPVMGKVVQMLEGVAEILNPPPPVPPKGVAEGSVYRTRMTGSSSSSSKSFDVFGNIVDYREQPSQRPVTDKVNVQMLEGVTEICKPPVPKGVAEGSICMTSMTAGSSSSTNVDIFANIVN